MVDGSGSLQQVLWWNGGGEELPSGRFDLAYTLRASDWRGSRQAQVEFVDYHSVDDKIVEIQHPALEIHDYRSVEDPMGTLSSIRNHPSTVILAEGNEKEQVGGSNRLELSPADHLVIWTIPPSPADLLAVLVKVQPRIVSIFSVYPINVDPGTFITRLLGLLKFALNHHQGEVNYTELAAATGQCSSTVRCGLDWLTKTGRINLESKSEEGNKFLCW